MNELVEPLAAQAGASGVFAVDGLPKEAAAKKAKKAKANTAAQKNLARTTSAIVLRNQDPADDIQIRIDRIPGAVATGAPMRRRMRAAPEGELIASKGKSAGPDPIRRGIRSMAGELFRLDGDRAGADRMGEIIARTPPLR